MAEKEVTKKTTAKKAEPKTDAKVKAPAKKEIKETAKKIIKDAPKIVKKFILKVKKENKAKSIEAKDNQKLLAEKKKTHPTFRGRFGKKYIRKRSNKKWQKWRKPRSIDLDRGLQHGFRPKIGYANKSEIKGIHPSGYVEVRVENVKDLAKVDVKLNAIRIGATVGKKKRNDIITEANKKGIWVLN